MELARYARILRAQWRNVTAVVVTCLAVAGALAWTDPPTYATTTSLFVSIADPHGAIAGSYEAELYAQQRARSYGDVLPGERLAQAVARRLGLPEGSVAGVRQDIHVGVPPDSALINVTVRDRSPRRAAAIARALAQEVPALVDRLEGQDGRARRVRVTVPTPADLPAGPVAPRKPVYLAMGLLLGLTFGVGAAVLRSAADRRVRTRADVARAARAPVLGTVAQSGARGPAALVLTDPWSPAAADVRAAAANVQALTAEHGLPSLLVCGAAPGDDASEVVANLGIALAQRHRRVVLVDARLREPALADLLELPGSAGLGDLLTRGFPSAGAVSRALSWDATLPLALLPAGSPRPDGRELLASARFSEVLDRLAEQFELVIVDAPALQSEAEVAGLARRVSAVVLVVRAGSTTKDALDRARRQLDAVGRRPLGVIVHGTGGRAADGPAHASMAGAGRR